MKNTVMIKSYQSGISLILEEQCEFEEILCEIAEKFHDARNFFGKNKMALSLEGRELTDIEQKNIVEVIQKNSDLEIVCLVLKDNKTEQNFIKAVEKVKHHLMNNHENSSQFYKGCLQDGQSIETESSIIIIGDVLNGASVISAHDIIVLGGLYGEAYAGADGDSRHFVCALDMAPSKLIIGGYTKEAEKQGKWGMKAKIQQKIAYVKNNRIITEPLTKELLSTF